MAPPILQMELEDHRCPPASKVDDECKGLQVHSKHDIQDKADQSDFLGLPGEVRNTISRYAITTDQWINLNGRKPGLLSVNRQMRRETERLYFTENKFELNQAIMLSHCAIAATLYKFHPLNAMNVFLVPCWSFGIPEWNPPRQRSKNHQQEVIQILKNVQELINFFTSSGHTPTLEVHILAATGVHDRQGKPNNDHHFQHDALSAFRIRFPKNQLSFRVTIHPVNWKKWIETLADLMTNEAPDQEVEWEIEMDLAGQSKSAYRNRIKFRKFICKSLE